MIKIILVLTCLNLGAGILILISNYFEYRKGVNRGHKEGFDLGYATSYNEGMRDL
jgi:hypothetical protein